MRATLDNLTPGFSQKLNFVLDLAVLVAAWQMTAVDGVGVPQLTSLAILCFVWCFAAAGLRLYSPTSPRRRLDSLALLFISVGAIAAVSVVSSVVAELSGAGLGHDLLRFVGLLGAGVIATNVVCKPLAAVDGPSESVLIVGTGALGRATFNRLTAAGPHQHHVIGFVRWPGEAGQGLPAPVLGDSDAIIDILAAYPVSEIYLAGRVLEQGEVMQKAVCACEEVGMPFALPLHSLRLDRALLLSNSAARDGYLHYLTGRSQPLQHAVKRFFDITASLLALTMLTPLFVVVASIIKLTSRGPVLFKQVRVGLHGSSFNLLKFRSMVVNAEELKARLRSQNEQSGPVFKMKMDPRVTRIGRFIRKYSIDELPQLVNILRGDMAIVGPRPALPAEVVQYKSWQRRRLSVRPGLTCYWQVSGRDQIGFDDWMRLDLNYVDNWDLGIDFALIARTVPLVITGRGAS